MEANSDLIDLLRALKAEGAKYLLVGGYAFAFHGKIRATKDVDVFVGTDSENAVTFEEAWGHRITASSGGELVHFIARDDLIKNKTAAARPQDLVDVAYLKGEDIS